MTATAADILIGEHVTLWPYVRSECARDLLYVFWNAVEQAGDWPRLLWGDPAKGDLTSWVQYISASYDPKILLFATDPQDALAGLIWYHRIRDGEAHGAVWVEPGHRGKASREIVKIGCRYMGEIFHIHTIWAETPWPEARNLIHRCGFEQVAAVDGYRTVGEEKRRTYLMKLNQENLYA